MRTVDEQKYFYKMFEEMWGDELWRSNAGRCTI